MGVVLEVADRGKADRAVPILAAPARADLGTAAAIGPAMVGLIKDDLEMEVQPNRSNRFNPAGRLIQPVPRIRQGPRARTGAGTATAIAGAPTDIRRAGAIVAG
jgi:hypothetical protein